VLEAHRRLAEEFGYQPDAVVRSARERAQHVEFSSDPAQRAREAVTFARDKNFEREAVVDERILVRDALRHGMGELRYPEVRTNLEARQSSGEFVSVERSVHQTGRLFTTAKTIAAEHEIVRRMCQGQNQLEPVLSRQKAIAAADAHPNLNPGQKSVVEDALSSRDSIQAIQGVAGAGKTTALVVIRTAAEAQGYKVEGFAPTSRAAKQLEQAGVHSGTLQSFLVRSHDSDPQHRRFFFIDESSLASTNQMRDFLRRLGPEDRILLIGDIRQHQGIEAGRPFQQLQEAGMQTARLDQIVRQRDPVLKAEV
jgi:ATP-dependent exoDNAse (exonuclease V) alpha subunit